MRSPSETLLYGDDTYFGDIETACDHFYGDDPELIPETLQPCVSVSLDELADDESLTILANSLIERIDNGDAGLECLSTQDDCFSEWTGATGASMVPFLKAWLASFGKMMDIEDTSSEPVPFKALALAYQEEGKQEEAAKLI